MMKIPVPNPYPIRPEFFFFQYLNPIRPEVENTYPLGPGSDPSLIN